MGSCLFLLAFLDIKGGSMEYQADGGVKVRGCAGTGLRRNYPVRYSVGERVWVGRKARMGKVESVVIKRSRVSVPDRPSPGGYATAVVYTDTFNRVWIENELVNQEEAQELLQWSAERKAAGVRAMYETGACFPISPEGCA